MCYAVFSAGPDTRQLVGSKQQSTWDWSLFKSELSCFGILYFAK